MAAYLKAHRKRADLTLDALAERTGLTKSYLSKVERGLSTPSIAVALKIARALNTDVGQLFSDDPDPTLMQVDRADDRTGEPATSTAHYLAVATGVSRKTMQPFVVRPTTEPDTKYLEHSGDEFVFVHSGSVEISVPGEQIVLHAGDSLYFAATTPHRIRSISAERAELIVVVAERESQTD
ncbi:helix-turn-helix domain-containing protein [Nocardia bhagyanarayanae]|uniref:XRE family transcriptional regulator n=1 Tax=Nocardia bhagyanarayanae TaxID=1215925 RepID=A0A543FEY7_9NOCA|nr:XRE family transcriptional regulator [Nocardia bhagyanarayanae]TQM32417.1 XRE family transcriptional regulator [Nocardia bhagyanarayanae]